MPAKLTGSAGASTGSAGRLESKFRRQLKLPRVESCPGRAYCAAGAGDAIAEVPWNLWGEVRRPAGNKVRCAIYGKHFVYIRAIEQVERIHGEVQHLALTQMESPRQTQVHGLQGAAAIAVAWRIAHAIGDRVAVIVGVKAHKQREWPR